MQCSQGHKFADTNHDVRLRMICNLVSLLDDCWRYTLVHGLQGLKRERREAASAAKEQKNGVSKGDTVMDGLELHTAE